MDENNKNPFEVRSVDVNKAPNPDILFLNKKRKFQAEQLGLRLSKHKSWDTSFISECGSPSDKSPQAEDFHTHIIKEKTDGGARDDGSEPESAKDSNSSVGDSDSTMSLYGEAKVEPVCAKTGAYDRPSTSSVNWGSNSFKNTLYTLDNRTVMKAGFDKDEVTFMGGERNPPPHHHDDGLQISQNLEEHLLEFGNHVDYICSQYGNDSSDQCTEKELEDILYLNGVNPNTYVLSSGRWTVNQEAQMRTKKPTIDQEFEQYFSKLML